MFQRMVKIIRAYTVLIVVVFCKAIFATRKCDVIKQMNTIWVIRLDEIGDMVLMSAFLRELRAGCPMSKIVLITKPAIKNLIVSCPHVNEVLTFQICTGLFKLFKQVFNAYLFCRSQRKEDEPDIAIVPRWDDDSAYGASWIAFFSGAPKRVAYSELVSHNKSVNCKGYDNLFTDLSYDSGLKHEVVRNLNLLKVLGIGYKSDALELWVDENDRKFADRVFTGKRDCG